MIAQFDNVIELKDRAAIIWHKLSRGSVPGNGRIELKTNGICSWKHHVTHLHRKRLHGHRHWHLSGLARWLPMGDLGKIERQNVGAFG